MTFNVFKMIQQPLITIGDEIALFLVELDLTIKNTCLLTSRKVKGLEFFFLVQTHIDTKENQIVLKF